MTHDGQETYAFIMSNKYILGLFTHCEAARKSVVSDGVEYGHLTEPEQRIVLLGRLPAELPKDLCAAFWG